MTPTSNIDTKSVTKPIQLLAAWLIGLITVDAGFLTAATHFAGGERTALIVASIVNVPLFLVALFLLQTRFRPEMQEDIFYSKYLDNKTNQVITKNRFDSFEVELKNIKEIVIQRSVQLELRPDLASPLMLASVSVGVNKHLENFASIMAKVESVGYRRPKAFGAKQAPVGAYMAVDENMDFQARIAAIKLAIACNIDGYGYFSPREEEIEESILIGAYGLEGGQIPLLPTLRRMLDDDVDPAQLREYEHSFVI